MNYYSRLSGFCKIKSQSLANSFLGKKVSPYPYLVSKSNHFNAFNITRNFLCKIKDLILHDISKITTASIFQTFMGIFGDMVIWF